VRHFRKRRIDLRRLRCEYRYDLLGFRRHQSPRRDSLFRRHRKRRNAGDRL
jgi:hypothetical protein